jgi:DNA-binding XRE family transcriptional regulator
MPSSARPAPESAPDAPGTWEGVVSSIGPKVHALRRERGMTLQQLAHLADVSTAAVHKVERGDMVPTITTLLKIAGALDAPIRHFVEDTEPGPGAVHTRFAGATVSGPVPITGQGDSLRVNGAVTRVAPGDGRTGLRRAGETLLVVLEGRLDMEIGDEQYTVGAGEALHFRTNLDHRSANVGDVPAEVIWVTVPED